MKRIFFSTDIHGSEVCFRKFINSAKHFKADVLILGGDLTGKIVVPIVKKEKTGLYEASVAGALRKVGEDGLPELYKSITYCGSYPYLISEEEYVNMQLDTAKIDELFSEAIEKSLTNWLQMAEEGLRSLGVPIYGMPGNDDPPIVEEVLKRSKYLENVEDRVIDVYGFELLSCGWSNHTPWNTRRETTENNLSEKIESMISRVKNRETMIFNFHVPPKDTQIDQAPKLDEKLKPQTAGGDIVTFSAGSSAVREAIEIYQPVISLHGHIHESRGRIMIGKKSHCFNPGSEYGEGILRGAIVNLDERKKKYVSSQFVAG